MQNTHALIPALTIDGIGNDFAELGDLASLQNALNTSSDVTLAVRELLHQAHAQFGFGPVAALLESI